MSQESNAIQARNFTEVYDAASSVTATTIFLGRGAIERSIRGLQDYLQEGLPMGNFLQPDTSSRDDDSYIVRLGPAYNHRPTSLRAKRVGEPPMKRWAAIKSAPTSPIHLLSLMEAGETAEPTGLYALRTSGKTYRDEVPIYFALSKEGTQFDELQAAEATAGLPLHLHLASGLAPGEPDVIQLPSFPGE